MTTYEYRCDNCGDFLTQYPIGQAPDIEICAGCGAECRRRYTIFMKEVMHEHWNHSAQAPVSSVRQHNEMLKKQSDEASERLGMDHNFESIPIHELRQKHAEED